MSGMVYVYFSAYMCFNQTALQKNTTSVICSLHPTPLFLTRDRPEGRPPGSLRLAGKSSSLCLETSETENRWRCDF